MAAVASNHVRRALFPFRLDTDGTGYVDIPRSLRRNKMLLLEDVNTIRETNNAIFSDIFWVHLAYATTENGIEHLRDLLTAERQHAALLSGFEKIDQGRRGLQDATAPAQARRRASDLIWAGNVQLLEHEQRVMVQPDFDRLSCAFARLISLGSATSFDVRGVRQRTGYFTSFYTYSLVRGGASLSGARQWPRITRFEDRWRWLEESVVPRFRRLDDDPSLLDAGLARISNEARVYASTPCLLPRSIQSPTSKPTLGWVVADCRAHHAAQHPVPEQRNHPADS
jgi:hypothetical protein